MAAWLSLATIRWLHSTKADRWYSCAMKTHGVCSIWDQSFWATRPSMIGSKGSFLEGINLGIKL